MHKVGGKDCMKKFCESLEKHAMKIINVKKKKMKLLRKEQQESNENAKICHICKKKLETKYVVDKKYRKVRDHCHCLGKYRDTMHSICNLKYSVPKRIPIAFHNGPNYHYYYYYYYYTKKSQQKNSKNNLLVQEKTLKNT